MLLFKDFALCICAMIWATSSLATPLILQIASQGGIYQEAQNEALFLPYSDASGIQIEQHDIPSDFEGLQQALSEQEWDVIDLPEAFAQRACEAGLLEPIDHNRVLGMGLRGINREFQGAEASSCFVPQNLYAHVFAFDERAFPGEKPSSVEDFFNLELFAGKRALQRGPDGALEWALLSEGAPAGQLYDLLSTDRGLRLAIAKLESIGPAIRWWKHPAEPVEWLRRGEVSMASGLNWQFFYAAQEGAPISIIWDGRLLGTNMWAIPKGADREEAEAFLRFALSPEQNARLSTLVPFGPARDAAFSWLGRHPRTGVAMSLHLPNSPDHTGRSLVRQAEWYTNTWAIRHQRFNAWLAGQN